MPKINGIVPKTIVIVLIKIAIPTIPTGTKALIIIHGKNKY